MKRITALLGGCAVLALALAACGDADKEEPKPMELGPDTAKADVVTAIDLAQGDAGSALCIGASCG